MSRLASLARLAAAGLFLYFGVMFAVIGLINVGWLQGRGVMSMVTVVVVGVAFGWAALKLFNPKGAPLLTGPSAAERIAELEQRGLIVDTSFTATRAFGVES